MTDVLDLLARGRMYRESGDPSTAARYLARAAEAEPRSRAVLTELALAQFQSAALGPAERTARRLLDLDPSDAYAHLLLGRALSRAARHREALPHLRLAAAMAPSPELDELIASAESRIVAVN
ncbi:tetratricopeptide repeat protein [Actinokineospora soli]|uniref:Tetratricopeptide repeat protein n=1 Tax=Actinokineospora soli TaxID=1048753 RepID=A0ABW2TJY0_9PSEU